MLGHAPPVPLYAWSAADSRRAEFMKTLRLRGFNISQSAGRWYRWGWIPENFGAMQRLTCKPPLEELPGSCRVPLL